MGGLTVDADTEVTFGFTTETAVDEYNLSINGAQIFTNRDNTGGNDLTGDVLVDAINANASATGVTASFDSVNNRVTLSAEDGRDIIIDEVDAGGGTPAAVTNGLTAAAGDNNSANSALDPAAVGSITARGSIRLTATEQITVGGSNPTDIGFTATSLALGNDALNTANVSTVEDANTAILRVDSALTAVNDFRSELGAIQNRFESTIANLATTSENLSASNSRILDADFAAETAKLSKAQVLQQAGISVLAQANARPQQVLSLLQ